jgi:calcium-dependent protein kinase
VAGTPYYIAPEVIVGLRTTKSDMWSVGVILYLLVSGYLPFQGDTQAELFARIKKVKYHFNHVEFKSVSENCMDLIKKLLVKNANERLSAADALKHPWFLQDTNTMQNSLDENVFKRLKKFKGKSQLKRAALNMLVKMTNSKKLESLYKQFQLIDTEHSGIIDAKKLLKAIKDIPGIKITEQEAIQIINELDYFKNGKIHYCEFIAATLDLNDSKFFGEKQYQALFSEFDPQGHGYLSRQDILNAMHKIGHDISLRELSIIFSMHD